MAIELKVRMLVYTPKVTLHHLLVEIVELQICEVDR